MTTSDWLRLRSTCRLGTRRSRGSLTALLLACALILALGGSVAQAAPKGTVGFFGEPGAGAGQFDTPNGVAVNESSGHVYVVDTGNNRVQEFDPFGNFMRAWGWGVQTGAAAFEVCSAPGPCLAGDDGAGAGQLDAPQGIAVDQATGNVYVTNRDNRRIEKFDSSGNFLFAFGWGVDTGAGAVETCTTASGCQASASGSNGGQFFSTFSGHVAIDPRNGDVVVADPGNRRVQRFDSTGSFLVAFGWGVDTGAAALETCTTASGCARGTPGTGDGQFSSNQPIRVAVDAAGSVYTVEGGGGRRVQKFNAAATSSGLFAPDHTTGTSNDTVPTNVAVNPANGHVLVAKDGQVLEFDIAGNLAETHVAGAGLPAANGMAVDGTNDRIYLSTTPDQRVFVLGTVTPPSATIAPTSDVTATTATFHGTVNPNNGALSTSYHFEYSDDGGLTWPSTPDVDVGNGTTEEDAIGAVTGLEPNTDYQVRLVATRPFGGGSATSAVDAFHTDPAPPAVSGTGAVEVTDTTAVLGGRVDPNRSHTTYRFEYGTDTSYGNATSADSAGSGAVPVPVSKPVTGLQPNTTYQFRLVATNAAGETPGQDGTFTTAAQPPQPSGRAYEMVSPVDKNGGDIARDLPLEQYNHQTGASASGDAVAFVSRAAFGELQSSPAFFPNYAARRDSNGWVTTGITPPMLGDFEGTEHPAVLGLSNDLTQAFVVTAAQLTPDAATLNGSWGLYVDSIGQAERYRLLSIRQAGLVPDPPETGLTFASERFEYEASTPDSRHVVFNSSRRLLQHGPADGTGRSTAVYEWLDGNIRLASVLPTEVELGSNPAVVAGSARAGQRLNDEVLHGDHVISDDGGRLFFTANVRPAGGGTGLGSPLFVREDGERTRVVSAPDEPGDDPVVATVAGFWAAKSDDGSVAFFTSSAPLTEGAANGSLYRWDANASDGEALTELSRDLGGLDPGVLGPAAVSDDARSVYFVATGVLAPGATRGAPNLYLWREGQAMRHVATLDGTGGFDTISGVDSMMWRLAWRLTGSRAARVSADGERLLFASYADPDELDPDELEHEYDTREGSQEACGDAAVPDDRCRQIYLYDAPSDDITCLTCVPGVALSGDANLLGNSDIRRSIFEARRADAPLSLPRNLSTDGRRAFFETSRPLVSSDQNSAVDVYEWEDPDLDGDGELRLISSGRSSTDSLFLDASVSGNDVFFTTRARLVGIDVDDQVDLYDARVGGGIPAQNPPPPAAPCQGEQCQGALSAAPSLPGVGSAAGSHGNLRPGPRPSFSVRRLSRRQRAKLARGARVVARVRVNQAGRVRLRARAKVGRRMRTVAKASKRARRAGTVRLGLKLSSSARRALARKRRLNVRLVVRFSGVREARTSMLRLRRTGSSGERRGR